MRLRRFVIVTGKGGVGKTTVAAGVARAAVEAGKRALLVEVARPGRLASLLGVPPLESEPRIVSPMLSAVALDETRALEALVGRLMPLRLIARRLLGSETFRIVAAAIPGIAEAALLAQVVVWLEETDRLRRPRYDTVILDAPASGHSVPLLATPRTLSGIATIGPLGNVLRRIAHWLGDPERTRCLVVSIPEDWAVAEAIELYRSLRDGLGVPLARPALNAVFPRRFSRREVDLLEQAEAASSLDPKLIEAGRFFVRRRDAAQAQSRALRSGTATKPLELPFIFSRTMLWHDLEPLAGALAPALE